MATICLIFTLLIILVNTGSDGATIRESNNSRPCILPYVDFPAREPVFLNLNYELIRPSGRAIILQPREKILLACPGKGNYLEAMALAICVGNTTLKVAEANHNLSTLNCKSAVTGDVREWSLVQCAGGRGRRIEIGHRINENYFRSLIVGCYDQSVGAALYTEHTIYGSAIDYGKPSHIRPDFKRGNSSIGFNPKAYTKVRQNQTFQNYFGINQQYINDGSYLARGHLAPDADFVFMTSRWATYFYVNVVPQWDREINQRNWKMLEMTIRKFVAREGTEFRVVTGSHGVLVLQNQEIYLDNGSLPVPALTWKVIQNKETMEAIGFITLNNAFDPPNVSECCLCPDISEEYGWKNENFSNYTMGFTYACDVNEMRKTLPNIPNVYQTNILVGPNFRGTWVVVPNRCPTKIL